MAFSTACIEPDATGAYTVVVTDELGCISAASEPVQVIITGLVPQEHDEIQLFPVPALDMLHIDQHQRQACFRLVVALFSVQDSFHRCGIVPCGLECTLKLLDEFVVRTHAWTPRDFDLLLTKDAIYLESFRAFLKFSLFSRFTP